MVALDGNEIQPMDVDGIILLPGETVDFYMEASQPGGLYWMRLRSWGVKNGPFDKPDGIINEGWAIIDYDSSTQEPSSTYFKCTDSKLCFIFNCPFPAFPQKDHKVCISVADARSAIDSATLKDTYGLEDNTGKIIENFYNFNYAVSSCINAHRFINPSVPVWQGIEENTTPCPTDCGEKCGCNCTFIDKIPLNSVLQIVLLNSAISPFTGHHTIHLHGYNFAVLKMGYPEYNQTSDYWIKQVNNDIKCDSKLCAFAKWRQGHATNLNLANPPIKDTVVIPAMGYVVLRLNASNPGFWFMHCHVDMHMIEGMAMVLHVGNTDTSKLPSGFPTCHNFD